MLSGDFVVKHILYTIENRFVKDEKIEGYNDSFYEKVYEFTFETYTSIQIGQ
jgi:hypothetical protein